MTKPEPGGPPSDLVRLTEVLDRHEVDYLLVGGAAAKAYGATRPTDDADCVVHRERTNLERLAAAMGKLNARLRVGGMSDAQAKELPVQLDATTFLNAGISTWMTDAGGFDILPGLVAADGRTVPYEELVQRETLIRGDGFSVRAAALEDIITAKEYADRPKDHDALPELREIAAERAQRESLEETLEILSDQTMTDAIDESEREVASGLDVTITEDEARGRWAR